MPGISRWSRRFVVSSAGYLVLWRTGVLLGGSRRTAVTLALFGFVCHMVFGMGYLLIPSYAQRVVTTEWAPAAHLGLANVGTVLLAAAPVDGVPQIVEQLGAVSWSGGVALFLGTLLWTVRDDLTVFDSTTVSSVVGANLGRAANLFVVLSLGYLAAGSYEVLARASILPGLTGGYFPRVTHLLAAGFAGLLVFALGVRLLPRFLGVPAPAWLVGLVLPAGALGPFFVALGFGRTEMLVLGALVEAVAVWGFGALYLDLLVQTDRWRVGFVGILVGVFSGILGVSLGVLFAFESVPVAVIRIHLELNLLGFLGLTIIGFAVQFFPPPAGRFRGANDRAARSVVLLVTGGLIVMAIGKAGAIPSVDYAGKALALVGASGYAYLVVRLVREIGFRAHGASDDS